MIHVEDVVKKFGKFVAVDNISCDIEEKCIYGMVGPNGAGKSTFLRLLSGIYKPNSGNVFIDGINVFYDIEAKQTLVFVSDELYFLPGATIESMENFYLSIYDGFDSEKFHQYLEMFSLDQKKSIISFSKGMKRQTAIILALATNAKYMFFDETFDGLDPSNRKKVKQIIKKEVDENGSTIIITSHSLKELEDICDHLALLHKGGLVLDSEVDAIKTKYYKIQMAFDEPYNEDMFKNLDVIKYTANASVVSIIVSGDRKSCVEHIKELKPKIIDILPLTLDEIFTYEIEALGQDVKNL